MSIFSRAFSHVKSGASTEKYYKSMNEALARLNQEYTMLHYPYHVNDNESFFEAQKNLTDYCMSQLPEVKGKNILEIGCGNGVQAQYIMKEYSPASLIAIDLNSSNIEIAQKEALKNGHENIKFHVDDAQDLKKIESNSMDYVINIESAFHYPDKPAFFREIARVLKPGGTYVIADVMATPKKRGGIMKFWKKKMHLNHWTLSKYKNEIPRANLEIHDYSDITREVIKSFSNYRLWLRGMAKKNFFEDRILKLYYTIHVRLNIILLQRRRQYCVIKGRKPVQ